MDTDSKYECVVKNKKINYKILILDTFNVK